MNQWSVGTDIRRVGICLAALAWACLAFSCARGAEEQRSAPGAGFFADPKVHSFKLQISSQDLKALRQEPHKFVKASVQADDTLYPEVAVHLKGSAGSFRNVDDKPAFNLNFSKFITGQKFHGLRKIRLNNSVQDPSFMNEYLAGELFRAAGVPATRVSFALVELNGHKLGMYVLKEGFAKEFLSMFFNDTKGNLYDNDPGREITERLEKDSGDGPDDRSDLQRLASAAREPDPAKIWGRLEPVLDVDRFISFMAMEIITCHWDGYCLGRNNFRVYHDNDTGKMLFFPHGTDQLFQRTGMAILPGMNGLVAQAVIRSPEGRRRYRERFAFLATNVFNVEVLTNRIAELSARIRPSLATWRYPLAGRQFDWCVQDFRDRVVQRGRYLEQQVNLPPPTPVHFENGIVKLTGWHRQGQGNIRFEQTTFEDRPALLIQCGNGAVGSWRTGVVLPAGSYRFKGMARTSGVVVQPGAQGGGGGLRISGSQRKYKLAGNAEWTRLEHQFKVSEDSREVVLVCELRAQKGRIWFDSSSLVLEQIE